MRLRSPANSTRGNGLAIPAMRCSRSATPSTELPGSPLRSTPTEVNFEVLRIASDLPTSAPETTVEDDLDRILDLAGLRGRQREIVVCRLGWDGEGGATLEAAANGELTRERVRQLEAR